MLLNISNYFTLTFYSLFYKNLPKIWLFSKFLPKFQQDFKKISLKKNLAEILLAICGSVTNNLPNISSKFNLTFTDGPKNVFKSSYIFQRFS